MVVEKESRSKEVMKIMGMGEGTYFLSYFVEYFIVNIIYALAVGYISQITFIYIPYWYLVLYLWLFGLNIFALAFFCQSFMDTTRLALIVSCLIYCLMLFVSAAVYEDNIKKTYKVISALLPPVNLLLGAFTIGEFERMYFHFKSKDVTSNYLNYSLSTCYIMFTIDFFIYLFLGYYLQNVIPHEYGVAKPWYFIFLPSYWCGDCCRAKKKSKKINNNELNNNIDNKKEENINIDNHNNNENNEAVTEKITIKNIEEDEISDTNNNDNSIFDDNPHKDEDDFQNEDIYRDKNKKNDVFMLRNVTKVYGDGKMACNKISFNLFRNEIFALLGRNGAGKTSLINVLIGMYDATSGQAIYKENNILEESNMNEFRNKLGICPQHDILFPKLTVREHLEMFCYFKGFDINKIKEEVDNTLNDFRIHDIENILAGTLSAGQRRKLSIAISVIGGSEVIFFCLWCHDGFLGSRDNRLQSGYRGSPIFALHIFMCSIHNLARDIVFQNYNFIFGIFGIFTMRESVHQLLKLLQCVCRHPRVTANITDLAIIAHSPQIHHIWNIPMSRMKTHISVDCQYRPSKIFVHIS